MKQSAKQFVSNCLRILWMVYFRRASFECEVEAMAPRQKRLLAIQFLVITIFAPFVVTLLTGLVFEAFDIDFRFTRGLRKAAFGLIYGVLGSVAVFGGAAGIMGGIMVGIAIGIQGSIAIGVKEGVKEGVAFGVASGLLIGVVLGIILGFIFGIAFSVTAGIVGGAVFGVPANIVLSVVLLVAFVALSIPANLILGVFFPSIKVPFSILVLWLARLLRQPGVPSIKTSLAYWNESFRSPQPFLTSFLAAAGEQNREAESKAIEQLTFSPQYRWVAEKALTEIGSRQLLSYKSTQEIANNAPSSSWITSAISIAENRSETRAFLQCLKISEEVKAAISSMSDYNKLKAYERAKRQLEELRNFSVFALRGHESRTFARIAQQWLALVNVEIDRLTAEEIEIDVIPDPYIPTNPLVSGSELFIGRTDATRLLEEHFLLRGEGAPIVLFGQPRIGKSSLLHNLDQRLTTNLIPVYVDMQRSAQVESTAGLLYNLAREICNALILRGWNVRQPKLADFGQEPFIVFDGYLDDVEQAIASLRESDNRLILTLDEFEVIEEKLTTGKISKDLMPFLRSMMQQRCGIRMLFAGTHTLDEMIGELWTPYFRSAVPFRVSYLDDASARRLITNPIKEFSLNYDAEAVEHLIEQTWRHPCLIQLTCSALVGLKNAERSRHANIEDVKKALKQALESGDYVFRGIWEWIPKRERTLLALIAYKQPATVEQLAPILKKSETEVRGMVERLIEAEMLARDEDSTRIQVELFRHWVVKHAVRTGMEFG